MPIIESAGQSGTYVNYSSKDGLSRYKRDTGENLPVRAVGGIPVNLLYRDRAVDDPKNAGEKLIFKEATLVLADPADPSPANNILITFQRDQYSGGKILAALHRAVTEHAGQPIFIQPYNLEIKKGDQLPDGKTADADRTYSGMSVYLASPDGTKRLTEKEKALVGLYPDGTSKSPETPPLKNAAGKEVVQNGRVMRDRSAFEAACEDLVKSISAKLRSSNAPTAGDAAASDAKPQASAASSKIHEEAAAAGVSLEDDIPF